MRETSLSSTAARGIDPADAARIDGRKSRGEQSRRRIVAALMSLVREGVITPTAEAVAARAKVGLRTVFRHFDDMETLYREVAVEIDAEVATAVAARVQGRDWRERLGRSIDMRVALFEDLMPFHIATSVHRHESPFLARKLVESAALQRALLRKVLPMAVAADRPRFEALDLVLSFDAWLRLRREQGLSRAAARRTVLRAASAVAGA